MRKYGSTIPNLNLCNMKTKHTSNRFRGKLLLAATLPLFVSGAFAANIHWMGGDGDWGAASNWTPGSIPGAGDSARFFTGTDAYDYPAESLVNVDGEYTTALTNVLVGMGKSVTFNMADGSTLSTGQIRIGTFLNGFEGTARLYVNGPSSGTATFNITSLAIHDHANNDGNIVQFSGSGLTVNATLNTAIGGGSNNNSLTVSDGAKFNTGLIAVSHQNTAAGATGGNNNSLLVTGSGTHVTSTGTNGQGLWVGATDRGNNNRISGNSAVIADGARMTISGSGSSTVSMRIGSHQSYRSANSVTVEGAGSVLELVKGDNNVAIYVGSNVDASTNYNNSLTIRNGGLLRTQGTTTVAGSNITQPMNRLTIGNGGTFQTNSTITSNGGLVQLEEGGFLLGEEFDGTAVAVEVNIGEGTTREGRVGRMEAAGSGLGQSVTVNINNRGVLGIGSSDASAASLLSLNSNLNFASGSQLELKIFGENAIDSIFLDSTGQMAIGDDVALVLLVTGGYTLKAGDTYQVFTGDLSSISGSFSDFILPTLADGLEWDTSNFNAAGNWALSVGGAIPEPSTVGLVMGGLALAGACILRRRQARR